MTDRIVECVPNFSEGRDRKVIDAITAAISAVEGAIVLDVDPGAATNRTVVTIVGAPEAVSEGAFQGIKKAAELIDMRRHAGEHARMGATDVCPFVPVRGLEMSDCAELARALGERVGSELGIPVFLYEEAASREERRNLATVRSGEYEGLADKLKQADWKPDFGPTSGFERSGATAIGARKFLIAYNVNLNTRQKRLATEVALEVREQGRNMRGPDGKFVRDENGVPIKRPGLLPSVKAVGWFIDEYGRAQVSCNLTDTDRASLHDVFDACAEEARKIGMRATGSELVGLVPLEAMLRAGRHYLARQGSCQGIPEKLVIEAAIQGLGLSELETFDPAERIIEYRLEEEGRLAALGVREFVDELSGDSPAPGGGSVAALVGSLAAGLASMVGNLTVGKKAYKAHWADCDRVAVRAQALKEAFLRDLDADTEAFDGLMAAFRRPKGTDEESAARDQAIREATRRAVLVPFGVLERTPEVVELAGEMLEKGNRNAASDAGCAASCAIACAETSWFNVIINLDGLEGDDDWAAEHRTRAREIVEEVRRRGRGVLDALLERF